MSADFAKTFHDINNTLGSLVINVEVIADDPKIEGFAREAASAALTEVRKLEEAIRNLRTQIEA